MIIGTGEEKYSWRCLAVCTNIAGKVRKDKATFTLQSGFFFFISWFLVSILPFLSYHAGKSIGIPKCSVLN